MATSPSPAGPSAEKPPASAFVAALTSFLLWGLVAPVYFKLLNGVGAVEIVAHRVVWTVVLVGAAVLVTKGPRAVMEAIGTRRRAGIFALTTALISVNWTIFIWAITNGRMVESSLGYFINPLINVLLGVFFLRERLSGRQLAAVAIAAAGVGYLVASHGVVPWVALSLALTFGFYALVRKKAAIDPVIGLLLETAFLVPLALGYLVWLGSANVFGTTTYDSLMLVLAGPVTAVPLVLFMMGAAKLKLSTIGLLQYIGPSGQLFLGVVIYGEVFTSAHLVAFACIWVALVVYSADAFTAHRAAVRAAAGD